MMARFDFGVSIIVESVEFLNVSRPETFEEAVKRISQDIKGPQPGDPHERHAREQDGRRNETTVARTAKSPIGAQKEHQTKNAAPDEKGGKPSQQAANIESAHKQNNDNTQERSRASNRNADPLFVDGSNRKSVRENRAVIG